jgi:hypothetical protein
MCIFEIFFSRRLASSLAFVMRKYGWRELVFSVFSVIASGPSCLPFLWLIALRVLLAKFCCVTNGSLLKDVRVPYSVSLNGKPCVVFIEAGKPVAFSCFMIDWFFESRSKLLIGDGSSISSSVSFNTLPPISFLGLLKWVDRIFCSVCICFG